MNHGLEDILAKHPPDLWKVEQVVVLDWFDGPLMGLCALSSPKVSFQFKIMARGCQDDTETNFNLYSIKAMPDNTVQQVVTLLSGLGNPQHPLWVPVWKFETETQQREAESQIDFLLSQAVESLLIIGTNDMLRFWGCWLQSRTMAL